MGRGVGQKSLCQPTTWVRPRFIFHNSQNSLYISNVFLRSKVINFTARHDMLYWILGYLWIFLGTMEYGWTSSVSTAIVALARLYWTYISMIFLLNLGLVMNIPWKDGIWVDFLWLGSCIMWHNRALPPDRSNFFRTQRQRVLLGRSCGFPRGSIPNRKKCPCSYPDIKIMIRFNLDDISLNIHTYLILSIKPIRVP